MAPKPSLWLLLTMLMFPQVVETIYSPALNSIAEVFSVNHSQVAQTISIYFFAFALGVIVWGLLADRLGRRPTMLLGLSLYSIFTFVAMVTDSFTLLLLARAGSAFGIAVGSVVTQTMLRDCFRGEELNKVFAFMGIGLSISPVLGMASGGLLVSFAGYQAVFTLLFVAALILLLINGWQLVETQQSNSSPRISKLLITMLGDKHIWLSAGLVALFNIALFSYYQLGGFHFKNFGLSNTQFGYSGIVLGLGTLLGSLINKSLLRRQTSPSRLLVLAAILLLFGAIGINAYITTVWFVMPMLLVVMAFGIAIPNLLSQALINYREQAGSAGAIFGLIYYLLIGAGLGLAGVIQHLGYVLLSCATLVFASLYFYRR